MMVWYVKVRKGGQITIPAGIRRSLRVRKGMIAVVRTEGRKIVIEFKEPELPVVSVGKRLANEDVKKILEEGIKDRITQVLG